MLYGWGDEDEDDKESEEVVGESWSEGDVEVLPCVLTNEDKLLAVGR